MVCRGWNKENKKEVISFVEAGASTVKWTHNPCLGSSESNSKVTTKNPKLTNIVIFAFEHDFSW